MTSRALVPGLALAFVTLAAPASAQTLSGTWEIESQGRRGAQTMTLSLVQDGAELTGTVTLAMGGRRGGGGGGAGAREIVIEDGSVEGNAFGFAITLEFAGNSVTQSFSGTFEGDSMEGTIEGGRGGGRPFTGRRGS